MPASPSVYALYVEKELVGKRVKGTKVKVIWKFACQPDLQTHEVELKHSLVSGKREIHLDGRSVFASKKFFSGSFSHSFRGEGSLANRELTIKIDDGFEGYVYDLLIDGILFHRNTRISILELEEIRKKAKNSKERSNSKEIHQIEYDSFTKKKPISLDGRSEQEGSSPKGSKSPEKEEEIDLLGTSNWSTPNISTAKAGAWSKANELDDLFRANYSRNSYPVSQTVPQTNPYSSYDIDSWGFEQAPDLGSNSKQTQNFAVQEPYSTVSTLTSDFNGFGFDNGFENRKSEPAFGYSYGVSQGATGPSYSNGTSNQASKAISDPFSNLVNLNNINKPPTSGVASEPNVYGGQSSSNGSQQHPNSFRPQGNFRTQSQSFGYGTGETSYGNPYVQRAGNNQYGMWGDNEVRGRSTSEQQNPFF